MRRLSLLAFLLASSSAQAELRCPVNSYKRVSCQIKAPATGATASVSSVIVCQLDPAEAIIIYPTNGKGEDALPAHFYRINTNLERVVGGLTTYGGTLEITTPEVRDGLKQGPLPAFVTVGGQRLEASCTLDKTPQSFRQQISYYPRLQ